MDQQTGVRVSRRNFLMGIAAAGIAGSLAGTMLTARAQADEADGDEGQAGEAGTVELHRGYCAAHGDKCFTQVVVAVDADGTIVAANIDEYQFMASDTEGVVPVPNSDVDLPECIVEGKVLVSKVDSNDAYSAHMAEAAGATQSWLDSIKAIEEFAVGKMPEELEDVDTVTGATLADTAGYCTAIAEVAQNDDIVSTGEGDLSDAVLGRALGVAHGTKTFASAVTLTAADGTVIATSIDEFQFLSLDNEGLVPVPNSDAGFGENYADGVALASKAVNNELYSSNMERGGSTQPWLDSIDAIEEALVGVADDAEVDVDAISGATLTDGANYVEIALDAARATEA